MQSPHRSSVLCSASYVVKQCMLFKVCMLFINNSLGFNFGTNGGCLHLNSKIVLMRVLNSMVINVPRFANDYCSRVGGRL